MLIGRMAVMRPGSWFFTVISEGETQSSDPWSRMLMPWMNIRMPASGDVLMNYNPWTNWGWSNYDAGNPEFEHEIFTKVALPGKQLGKLTAAVSTLIDLFEAVHPGLEEGPSEEAVAIREFKELAEQIADRKAELEGTAKGNAESALRRLSMLILRPTLN